jgi:hypothetical protein
MVDVVFVSVCRAFGGGLERFILACLSVYIRDREREDVLEG